MIEIDVSGLEEEFEEGFEQLKEETRNALHRIGTTYEATAKANGSYQNRTGNLRNSNGYGIAEGGILGEVVGNDNFKAGLEGQDLTGDMVVECGAGMHYASYVQRKGFDVTDSGQLAAENEARRLFE